MTSSFGHCRHGFPQGYACPVCKVDCAMPASMGTTINGYPADTSSMIMSSLLRELENAQKALEQHHKDLLGLVEALRESAREDFDKSKNMNWSEWVRDRAFGEAQGKFKSADQLESLINPKD